MGSALVVAAVKYGLLALLWLFVVVAFRTVRNDLFGAAQAPAPRGRGPCRPRPRPRSPARPAGARRPRRAAAPRAGSSSPRARSPARPSGSATTR